MIVRMQLNHEQWLGVQCCMGGAEEAGLLGELVPPSASSCLCFLSLSSEEDTVGSRLKAPHK